MKLFSLSVGETASIALKTVGNTVSRYAPGLKALVDVIRQSAPFKKTGKPIITGLTTDPYIALVTGIEGDIGFRIDGMVSDETEAFLGGRATVRVLMALGVESFDACMNSHIGSNIVETFNHAQASGDEETVNAIQTALQSLKKDFKAVIRYDERKKASLNAIETKTDSPPISPPSPSKKTSKTVSK